MQPHDEHLRRLPAASDSPTPPGSPQDSGDGVGDGEALIACIDAFAAAWEARQESDSPPSIRDFLPRDSDGPEYRPALIELIKLDMEFRLIRPTTQRRLSPADATELVCPPVRLESYLADFPELIEADGPPAELIHEEIHLRRAAGEAPVGSEIAARFPSRLEEVRRLLPAGIAAYEDDLRTNRDVESLHPGERLDDFELLQKLGQGAFGAVFLARQTSMQRLVALKVSAARGAEAQTLAQLDHAHIVRVFDQRVMDDRGIRLLYMQFVPGGTLHSLIAAVHQATSHQATSTDAAGTAVAKSLASHLERYGLTLEPATRERLERESLPELTCRVGAELADALDYAHQRGVLHRDVKPANVLIGSDGSAKLADFNISFDGQAPAANPSAYFGGSLAYMSPEQLDAMNPNRPARPEDLDRRADLYSLGVVLWELLFGWRPLDAPAQIATHRSRDSGRAVELADRGGVVEAARESRRLLAMAGSWPDRLAAMSDARRADSARVPAEADAPTCRVAETLRRCIEPRPEDRFQSGERLARALRRLLHPRAASLLDFPRRGWRAAAARFPMVLVLAAVLVPNAAAGVFNYLYNKHEIIDRMPNAESAFAYVQATINLTAFPLGLLALGALFWPVRRAMRRATDRRPASSGGTRPAPHSLEPTHGPMRSTGESDRVPQRVESTRTVRRRALSFGLIAAGLGIAEWTFAGILYPAVLHLAAGPVHAAQFIHFVLSLALCGMVAAAYPFFIVSFVMLRVIYPALLVGGSESDDEQHDDALLAAVARRASMFLFLAAAVPALSVVGLVLASMFTDSPNVMAMLVFSLLGVVGFGAAFLLHRSIQLDAAALRYAANPVGRSGRGDG